MKIVPLCMRTCAPIYPRCRFTHAGVGAGTIEIPLTMTPTPLDDPLFDELLGSAAGGVLGSAAEELLGSAAEELLGELLGGLLGLGTSELAWAGARVSVEGGGAPAAAPLVLTSCPSASPTVSTNNTVGPATTAWFWRSCRLLFNGWSSGVTQITTGPLMFGGTTHWLSGCEMLTGRPPTIIWQLKFCGRRAP